MNVNIQHLRKAFDFLVTHLEATGQGALEIPWDFYWEISREDRYEPYSEPKTLSLGQLSDDWNELDRIVNGEMPPVGYALVWLSSILRALGEVAER